MTQNYYFEYRFIPGLLDQVKQGKNPLLSLIDIRWMKELLDKNNIDIDWDGFSVDVYDELYNKTSLEKGKYIAYTFPQIVSVPEAKYGVIDIETKKYYTFESDISEDYWAIGSQDVNCHSLIEMVQMDMSLEEFMRSLKRSETSSDNSGKRRGGCLSVIVLFIAVVSIIVLTSCEKKNEQPQAGPKDAPKEVVTHCDPYLAGDDDENGDTCPKCGNDSIIEILYGLRYLDIDSCNGKKRYVGGGCVIRKTSKRFVCRKCRYTWGLLPYYLKKEK